MKVIFDRIGISGAIFIAVFSAAHAQSDACRGLWVGEVVLGYVTEVSVPLDEDNKLKAPDPLIPTPTADAANLRLILHVSGAGQVSLIKDVAVLRRTTGTNTFLTSEHDMALVTDERLYGQFPPQPAVRIAGSVFDFGESRATEALNAIVDAAVSAVTNPVRTAGFFDTEDQRDAVEATARSAAVAAAQPVADNADVAGAFSGWLGTYMKSSDVDAIALAANPTNQAQTAMAHASNLVSRSFYNDSRAVDMVETMLAVLSTAGTNAADRKAAAHTVAAQFADVGDNYHRFIAGEVLGDMIEAASAAAGTVATNPAVTPSEIRAVLDADPGVAAARAKALQLKQVPYDDQRFSAACERLLDAIIARAIESAGGQASEIARSAALAGESMLATNVTRYAVAPDNPTTDYDDFVQSGAFQDSVDTAAAAAAEGAVSERHNNGLYTAASLASAARVAAVTALDDIYKEAARAMRTELPMAGRFGPGEGDARLVWEISRTNTFWALGPAALTGDIYLPGRHPTNPFRHRRHPDHTAGRDIRRHIRLDFDGTPTNGLMRAGFGVDRITGIYREEITGLHKPLGLGKNIGLKTEGRFELNRVSLIDALNAL